MSAPGSSELIANLDRAIATGVRAEADLKRIVEAMQRNAKRNAGTLLLDWGDMFGLRLVFLGLRMRKLTLQARRSLAAFVAELRTLARSADGQPLADEIRWLELTDERPPDRFRRQTNILRARVASLVRRMQQWRS